MNPFSRFFKKNVVRIFGFALLAALLTPPLFAAGVTVRFAGGPTGEFSGALGEEWAKKTENKVEYIFGPRDVSEALQVYQQYWEAKSPDVDFS